VCPFCISVIKMYIFLIPIDFISIAICISHILYRHVSDPVYIFYKKFSFDVAANSMPI
jgi:hypothetical protein